MGCVLSTTVIVLLFSHDVWPSSDVPLYYMLRTVGGAELILANTFFLLLSLLFHDRLV